MLQPASILGLILTLMPLATDVADGQEAGANLFAEAGAGWWVSGTAKFDPAGWNDFRVSHRRRAEAEEAALRIEIRHATVTNTKQVFAEQIALKIDQGKPEVAACELSGDPVERSRESAIFSYSECPIPWSLSQALLDADVVVLQIDTNRKMFKARELSRKQLERLQTEKR